MKPSPLIQPTIEAMCARFRSNDEGLSAAVDLAVLVAAADGRIDRAEMAALSASLEASTPKACATRLIASGASRA